MAGSTILCPASITLCFERCIAASIVIDCVSTLMPATYCYGDISCRDTLVCKHCRTCSLPNRADSENTQTLCWGRKLWLISGHFGKFGAISNQKLTVFFPFVFFLRIAYLRSLKWKRQKKSTNRLIFLLHVCDFCALLGRCGQSAVSVSLENPSWRVPGDKQTHVLLRISAMQQTTYISS